MLKFSKTLTALAAAATFVAVAVATPQQAEARRGGNGGAVAAGVIGGLALGAIIGSTANARGYYGGGPAYYGRPSYYGPAPVYYGRPYRPHCYTTRERVWDGYGWRSQRVRVCR